MRKKWQLTNLENCLGPPGAPLNKVTVGGKKRSGGTLEVLELEFNFVLAAEIIHVLNWISEYPDYVFKYFFFFI